jgi:hypothetical protein
MRSIKSPPLPNYQTVQQFFGAKSDIFYAVAPQSHDHDSDESTLALSYRALNVLIR